MNVKKNSYIISMTPGSFKLFQNKSLALRFSLLKLISECIKEWRASGDDVKPERIRFQKKAIKIISSKTTCQFGVTNGESRAERVVTGKVELLNKWLAFFCLLGYFWLVVFTTIKDRLVLVLLLAAIVAEGGRPSIGTRIGYPAVTAGSIVSTVAATNCFDQGWSHQSHHEDIEKQVSCSPSHLWQLTVSSSSD